MKMTKFNLIDIMKKVTTELSVTMPQLAKKVRDNKYFVGAVVDYDDLGVPKRSILIDFTIGMDLSLSEQDYYFKLVDMYEQLNEIDGYKV